MTTPALPSALRDDLALPAGFGFGEHHALLQRTARRLLEEQCSFAEVRRLATDPSGWSPALWREIAAAGWPGLGIPEADGGAGLDHLALALVLEEAGRALLPAPLTLSILAAEAIGHAGDAHARRRWLPELARGARIATVALAEAGSAEPDAVRATARRDGDGWILDGDKPHVGWASAVDLVVAPFRVGAGGELALFAIELRGDPAGLTLTEEVAIDPTRRAGRLRFASVRVPDSARLGDPGAAALAAWRRVHALAWMLFAAEAVGAAEAILGRTTRYASERIQFDRPIGSFQAVKHPLVNVMLAVEQARSLVLAAAATLDAADDATLPRAAIAARMAKAAAGDALRFAADRGVQLHGGYGFTWDCDAHFFVKRGLWTTATLGDAVHHRRHLAAALLDEA